MKPNTKRFLLKRELREVFIVRSPGAIRSFCIECAAESEFLTLDRSVSLCGKTTREILFEIETGSIHAQETASGHLLICRQSLGR